MKKNKPFFTANVREITDQWDREEISYGKMVEMLNDVALDWFNKSPEPPIYTLVMVSGARYNIDQDNYDKLINECNTMTHVKLRCSNRTLKNKIVMISFAHIVSIEIHE